MAKEIQHGTSTASRNGCRCAICRAANSKRVNEWRWKTGARTRGRKASYETLRLRKQQRVDAYNLAPRRCKRCGTVLDYERRADQHCSLECGRKSDKAIAHARRIAVLGGKENGRKQKAKLTDDEFNVNVRLCAYRGAARRRGLEFALSKEQFARIIKSDCWYCGGPPQSTWRPTERRAAPLLNGIDRVNNSKGYTVGNSVACCGPCNRAKNVMGLEEFIALAKRIAVRH